MIPYMTNVHCKGGGCRKLKKGKKHTSSPNLISAWPNPLSCGISSTIRNPETKILNFTKYITRLTSILKEHTRRFNKLSFICP